MDWGHILFYLLFQGGKDKPYLEGKGFSLAQRLLRDVLSPTPTRRLKGWMRKESSNCYVSPAAKIPPKKHKVSLQRTPVARWTT